MKVRQLYRKEITLKRFKIDDSVFTDIEEIKISINIAFDNKSPKRKSHYKYIKYIDRYAKNIKYLLENDKFEPKKNPPFTRIDEVSGKKRDIDSAPFYPDQIIHTHLIRLSQECFKHSMVEQCCACVPGRGSHYGKRMVEKTCRQPKKQFYTKLDIKKYYPSVKNKFAVQALHNKFKKCLWRDTFEKVLMAYDYLPIGLLTSQWIANLILEKADHYLSEKLKIHTRYRYMDDFVLFHTNKKKLAEACVAFIKYIKDTLSLTIKGNWNIHRFDWIDKNGEHRGKPLDFLGFKFYCDHTEIRKTIFKRIRRRCIRMSWKGVTLYRARASMAGYGYLKNTDSQKAYKKYMKPFFKKMKGEIRNESRRRYKANQCRDKSSN